MDQFDKKILKLLEKNARLSCEDIAVVTELAEDEVASRISALEKAGIIRGYKGVVDWEKVDPDRVSAIIELKVTPICACDRAGTLFFLRRRRTDQAVRRRSRGTAAPSHTRPDRPGQGHATPGSPDSALCR